MKTIRLKATVLEAGTRAREPHAADEYSYAEIALANDPFERRMVVPVSRTESKELAALLYETVTVTIADDKTPSLDAFSVGELKVVRDALCEAMDQHANRETGALGSQFDAMLRAVIASRAAEQQL